MRADFTSYFVLAFGVTNLESRCCEAFVRQRPFSSPPRNNLSHVTTSLCMSLKPAALPLMDSGKALARSGELLIDMTAAIDLYGGGLSAAGAQIRNAGDNIAQAAASCRFKTGRELVLDELRQAADALEEAAMKLELAVQEAVADEMKPLQNSLAASIGPVSACAKALEAAGASIMQGTTTAVTGKHLVEAAAQLLEFSTIVPSMAEKESNCKTASERMTFAAEKMKQAGQELQGIKPEKPSGKSWLKSA